MNEHSPITFADAAMLERYFALATESSATGRTLERARAYGIATQEAREKRAKDNAALRKQAVKLGMPPASLPWELNPLTANITSETRAEPSHEHDYERSAMQAFVSRRLSRMTDRDGQIAHATLRCYFGIEGNHFAIGYISDETGKPIHPLPRIMALTHLTASGRRLLERAHNLLSPGLQQLAQYARARVLAQNREAPTYAHLAETWAMVDVETRELYRFAARAWNDAKAKAPDI